MKAPMSERARRLLADEEAAQKIVGAARQGTPTPVEVKGKTYVVQKAPDYRPSEMGEGNGASAWIDHLRGLLSKS
jgi:hypothetical protein